jgi:hypothetical protein
VKLTYNNPTFRKGEEVAIDGLIGLFKNGESFELSDEEVKEYKNRTGNSLADVVDKNDNFTKGGAK